MKKRNSYSNIPLTLAVPVFILVSLAYAATGTAAEQALNKPPKGFVALFNGKDLTGWKGLLKGPYDNPSRRAELSPDKLKELQKEADDNMRENWKVADGALVFSGKGRSLCTAKDYGDFEMLVDWKILKDGKTATAAFICEAHPRCRYGTRTGRTPTSVRAACTTTRRIRASRQSKPTSPSASGTRLEFS